MRIALALIHVLRRAVPAAMRDRWSEEWEAEVRHAAGQFPDRRWRRLRVLAFAAGAVPDVIGLHRLPRTACPAEAPARRRVAVDRGVWLGSVGQDVRHAARNLRGAPAFTATVVASLSLGIAVVTGAYAFINAALFPMLPGVTDQQDLIEIYMERSTLDEREALRKALPGVRVVASTMGRQLAVGVANQALSVRGMLVSANYFDVLGTRVQAGRDFHDTEDRPGNGAVVVLGAALSRRLFGEGNPVGASMTVGGHPVEIAGVAEEGFRGTYVNVDADVDVFVAWGMADRLVTERANDFQRPDPAPGEYELTHIARLSAPGLVEAALDQARLIAPRLVTARIGAKYRPVTRARRLGWDDDENIAPQIAAILAVPGLVLLIGCINAATLILARGTRRGRDIAVRLALGASRWRIVRSLLAESLLLALIAGVVTLPVLFWTATAVERLTLAPFEFDVRVAIFAILLSCASVFVFGLMPAMRLATASHGAALGSSRAGETPRRSRMRQALVAVQVALCIALLGTGAQLITGVRQLVAATGVDDPSRLLMVSFDLAQLNAPAARAEGFYSGLLERVERLPGVSRAGIGGTGAVWTDGRGKSQNNAVVVWPPGEKPERGRVWIGGYAGGNLIEATGLSLVAGRLFTSADRTGTPRVAVVNQTAALRHFNGAAVGRVIRVAPRNTTYGASREVEIVGVIEAALDPGYVSNPEDPTVEAIYLPERLQHEPALTLYVRTREGAPPVLPDIQRAASSVDPSVPIVGSATLAQHQLKQQLELRVAAQGVTVLGMVGLALAAGGIYGMLAFIVASRRREIGVRMALGARPQTILQSMLAQGMRTAMIGAAAGGAAALGVSAVVRAQMYGVPPIDVFALAGTAAILLAAVLVASVIPARSASRVDPLVVLREE